MLTDFNIPEKKNSLENAYTNKQLISEEKVLSVHYFLEVSPTGEILEDITAYGKADLEEQCRLVTEIIEKKYGKRPYEDKDIICPRCGKLHSPSSWNLMSGNPLSQKYFLCHDCGNVQGDWTAFFLTATEIHYSHKVGNCGQTDWIIIKREVKKPN